MEALFGLILTVLSFFYGKVAAKVREHDTLGVGMKALLHDRIMQAYGYFYREQGYCSIHDMENIEDMFQAYKGLGGNGIIDELMERIRDLPTEP